MLLMRQVRVVFPLLCELRTAETHLHSLGHILILKPGSIFILYKAEERMYWLKFWFIRLPWAVTNWMFLSTLTNRSLSTLTAPEHLYVPSSPSCTLSMYADLSTHMEEHGENLRSEETLKDEGSLSCRLDVLDTLFQVELLKYNLLEKMQGRVTEDPNCAYTTSELSLGTRIPERDNKMKSDQILTSKILTTLNTIFMTIILSNIQFIQ